MKLKDAQTEKDVENAYRAEFMSLVPSAKITSPFGSDGYLEFDTVRALLEFKFDWDMKRKTESGKALGQLIFYVKKFETAGQILPNVLFVGDKNECLVLDTASVQKFLDMKINWDLPPSQGDPELVRAIIDDTDITPFVFNVDDSFDFRIVLDKVKALASGEVKKVRATPSNIGAMFVYWQSDVFIKTDMTPVEQVDVFLKCLFGGAYLHPTKKLLVVEGIEGEGIPINVNLYNSFFSHFEQGYKPSEIEVFYSQKDRLVEDTARRRQGAFFTPVLWVNEAHRMVSEVLGPDWRSDCLVWDSAAGTGNLTRDYEFDDLIISTCEKPDIEVIKAQGYNPGAEIFLYDFLNDDSSLFFDEINVIPPRVQDKLLKAAKDGKRLVFFINPPYGTAKSGTTKEGESKAGIADTDVGKEMRPVCGPPAQQLYAQFMYRCLKIAKEYGFQKYTLALYSMSQFMVSGSYRKFRDFWYQNFEYQQGMLFQASHFADVSDRWGISFTVWNEGRTKHDKDLPITLKDIQDFEVTGTGIKHLYNSDDREASKWVRLEVNKLKTQDAPNQTSGLKIKKAGNGCRGTLVDRALGYFYNNGSSVQYNDQFVGLFSSVFSGAHGLSIIPDNFLKVNALYAARKLIANTWIINSDEYLTPTDTESEAYKQWNADAVIYALLETKNNSTSLRQVKYADQTWTIHNHYFWIPHKTALELLDDPKTINLYRDCRNNPAKDVFGNPVISSPDTYLAHILPSLALALSNEAKAVLEAMTALWKQSLPYRETYAQEHPEYQLLNWDAGVYQLKYLWRDLFPKEWEALRQAHARLAGKLRPGVYEHGFLTL